MATALQPAAIRTPLLACGYRPDLLRSDLRFGAGQVAPVVGFAQAPTDSRSACVVVTNAGSDPHLAAEECRALGAPIVFVCAGNVLQWWKQGSKSPEFLESIPEIDLENFFDRRKDELSPETVYRAKTWGRFKTEYQLSFVDLGLMPLVEEEVGKSLADLIEHNLSDLQAGLGRANTSAATGQWLLQSIFWLVSAKILHDKQVGAFRDLTLTNVDEVFARLGAHYGAVPLTIRTRREREGLYSVAQAISRFSSLALTTTESLAYVYENALISKKTRTELGTHSTPSFLVDYVVGNLSDWIAEIPVDERSVFEPACGHAAFLVSAMRLLTELLPPDRAVPRKRGPYLRSRLHGSDIDSFALELARLSLTLTDIPNPDGWDLKAGDMFIGESLGEQAKASTILLANPPFDNFSPKEKASYQRKNTELTFVNKSVEMLWRTLPKLRGRAVFGLVLPQSFLQNSNAKEARKELLSTFEVREVCLFPDRVFSFSDAESVVLLGRRKIAGHEKRVRYRRVRERQLSSFRSTYEASSTITVNQSSFREQPDYSLRLADLHEIWSYCAEYQRLEDVCSAGQGFSFHGADLPEKSCTFSDKKFQGGQLGFIHFDSGLQLHELPKSSWVNLDSEVIQRPRSGTVSGIPQVLLNYAPAGRGPWRLKALIDAKGHPVSSRFIAVRPNAGPYSILALWAILNSPIANAFVFSHLGKRDNVVGDVKKMPMPVKASFGRLETVASRYLKEASLNSGSAKLKGMLLDVDCEVLSLYALPADLERLILERFTGWVRVGVPFNQTFYLPDGFRAEVSLADFRKIEESWPRTNRERGLLIDQQIAGKLDDAQRARLELLQQYADYHINQVAPVPINELDELERTLLTRLIDGGQKS
ncbi:MAG TPA: N-6 DNA methylase [Terracidiphilus sp.]|nr:N-6 DNA methylase [Terracidiphilus sp.]